MDEKEKFFKKISPKDREAIDSAIGNLISGNTKGLDIAKLRGYNNIFRLRVRSFRVIYKAQEDGVIIISVDRRSDTTYKNL